MLATAQAAKAETLARYTEGHKKKTRDRILRHSAELLEEGGDWPPSIQQVMARAGLTHGAFYAHFRSKTEFAAAALDYAFDTARSRWHDLLASVPDAEKLEMLLRLCLDDGESRPTGVCATASAVPSPQGNLACARERVAAQNRRMIDLVALHLPPGGTAEERADRAALLYAGVLGTRLLMRGERDPAAARCLASAGLSGSLKFANMPWGTA